MGRKRTPQPVNTVGRRSRKRRTRQTRQTRQVRVTGLLRPQPDMAKLARAIIDIALAKQRNQTNQPNLFDRQEDDPSNNLTKNGEASDGSRASS